ncbi:MAG TPA: ATP-binding protein, partial [Syntrophales bacterium]|nr:ATP-binding protein [Syntrophales bacterium]
RLELLEYPVEAVLQKLVRLVGEEAAPRGIAIETAGLDSTTPILMDVDKLQQAFLNIIKNAMESINGAGKISVFLEAAGSDGVSVRITDTGGGLTPEEIDRIFNPEYTTKEKGLGLGLPIAHEIIRSHGGDIRVQSRVGVGTTFDIRLPRKKGETEETKNTKRKDASGTG